MSQNRRAGLHWLITFLILAALPALACTTILGPGEEEVNSAVIDATIAAEDASAEQPTPPPAEEPTVEPAAPMEEPSEELETSPTEESVPAPAEDADAGGEIGLDALDSIFRAQRSGLDVDALRITIINEDLDSGETLSSTFEFIRPDRFRMDSQGFELIIIGDQTFINDGSGTWIESPVPMDDMLEGTIEAFIDEGLIEELLKDLEVTIRDVESLGQETINDRNTNVYTYKSKSIFDDSFVLTKVWVGVDDGLLYQQQVETESGGIRGRTTMIYDYGSDVMIEAPIP